MSRWIFVSALLADLMLLGPPVGADEPLLAGDLNDNVRARLVSARTSESRGQYLVAVFRTVKEKEPRTIVVRFPAHSFTPHEQTLRAVIESCCPRRGERHAERPAVVEATFSIPDAAAWRKLGQAEGLRRCVLLNIRLAGEKAGRAR